MAASPVARLVASFDCTIEAAADHGMPSEFIAALTALKFEAVDALQRGRGGLRQGPARSAKRRAEERKHWLAEAIGNIRRGHGTGGSFRAFVAYVQQKLKKQGGDPEPTYAAVRAYLGRHLPPEVMARWREV